LFCLQNIKSDSQLICYHLCNNKISKHLKFILVHGTETLFKIDLWTQLRYSCLTLALLKTSSICFKTDTHLRFDIDSTFDFLLFGSYSTTTNQMLTHYARVSFLTLTSERQWLQTRIFNDSMLFSSRLLIKTLKHARTIVHLLTVFFTFTTLCHLRFEKTL